MAHELKITKVGMAECLSADKKGISLNLTHASAGDSLYTPNENQTELVNERQRVEINQYKKKSDTTLDIVIKFSGPLSYHVCEIGLWLESGTLLGVISSPNEELSFKPKDGHCIVPLTLNFSVLPAGVINVVVGLENLNILVDEQFEKLAVAQINNMNSHLKLKFDLMNKGVI